jgi:hypothetical protein
MLVSNIEKIYSYSGVEAVYGKLTKLSASDAMCIVAGTAVAFYLWQTFVCDPLHKFPSPVGAKLSRIYESQVRASGKEYLITDGLHQEYGNVVRIGRYLKLIYTLIACKH